MKKLTYKILSDNRTLIMGFAIIAIMIFHYTEDCFRFNYNFNGPVKFYFDYFGSVGVDIFLMLSALGLYYSFKKNNKLKQFFYKRYTRVLIPYFIIAIPSYIWLCIHEHFKFYTFFKSVTFINLIEHHDIWFWYIFFICVCYLIFPILFNYIESSKNRQEISTKIINLSTSVTILCLLLFLFNRDVFSNFNIMLLRFLPFFVGIYLGYLSYNKEKFEYSDYLLFIIGLLFMFTANSNNTIVSRYSSYFFVAALIFIFLIILVKYLDKYKITNFFRKIIEWFGTYSLEIYLIHVSLRHIFNSYGLDGCRIRYFGLYVVITIILVPLLNYLVKKIKGLFDKKFIH